MKPLICISFLAFLFVNACKPAGSDPANDNSTIVLKDTISPFSAKRLVKNYAKSSYHPILDSTGRCKDTFDTRCVWFGKEQLKALVDSIYKEKGDGIRFYFAAYDKKQCEVPVNCDYLGYTTLVMVSTKRDSTKKNNKWKYFHADYFGGKKPGPRGAILTTTPENRGEICPPPSNCSDDGATLLD